MHQNTIKTTLSAVKNGEQSHIHAGFYVLGGLYDYPLNVLTMFLAPFLDFKRLETISAYGFHLKHLNLCSEDKQRSQGIGTT